MKLKQPQGLAEGIYFDLSNDAYHADPALSHSGMTKLLVSWPDYWAHSCLNPNRREYKPTEAMIFGERSGMYLLENEKFHQKFSTYHRNGNAGDGIYLSSVEYKKIKESIDCIREVPIANAYFSDGYPEVSIFWRDQETGVMLRARIDYLRHFGAIDFKRIAELNNWGIGKAVKSQGLDIQAFLYLEAIVMARRMLQGKKPNVHGQVDPKWLKQFAADEDLLFQFLFQRSTPPYIWEARELAMDVYREGENATRQAIRRYVDGITRYGTGRPPCGDGVVKEISQFHIPRRDYDS